MRLPASIMMLLTTCIPPSLRAGPSTELETAWEHWHHGRVAEAERLADSLLLVNLELHEARHLKVLTSFAAGNYEAAIAAHSSLPRSSGTWQQLVPLIVNAYEHLGRLDEALALAREGRSRPAVLRTLEERRRRPLRVGLAQTTVVPFADAQANPIADFMPAVAVTINNERRIAHLDTGGAFIVMSPRAAAELGIATESVGEGRASARATRIEAGMAGELKIGDATLTNVPVNVVSVLDDADQPKAVQIILGTQVLAQFLSTWDNVGQRLVLSPRRDAAIRERHLAALPTGGQEIDFYMLGDHFLLVKGEVGERTDQVFFLDTGLVAVDAEGRQAALAITPAVAKEWGLKGQPFSPSPGAIRLGPLEQAGHSVMTLDFAKGVPWYGVEVGALLSHGFLKSCVFTLDFDRRKLLVAQARKQDAARDGD